MNNLLALPLPWPSTPNEPSELLDTEIVGCHRCYSHHDHRCPAHCYVLGCFHFLGCCLSNCLLCCRHLCCWIRPLLLLSIRPATAAATAFVPAAFILECCFSAVTVARAAIFHYCCRPPGAPLFHPTFLPLGAPLLDPRALFMLLVPSETLLPDYVSLPVIAAACVASVSPWIKLLQPPCCCFNFFC